VPLVALFPWRFQSNGYTVCGHSTGELALPCIPPHLIVDFLYSKLIALAFRQGVVNIADLYFDAAIVCLTFMVGRSLITRVMHRSSAAYLGRHPTEPVENFRKRSRFAR